jgi:mannitol-1-phosphate/altronate dehydrogenase
MHVTTTIGRVPAQPLNESTLRTLAAAIAVPTYNRARLKTAILHLGVGGFHRAHQAVYLDSLAGQRISQEWGLTGVGLLPQDKRMEQALLPQQCLYTLVVRGAEDESAQVIGSLTRYLFAPEQREAVLQALADPETRIVSLTITEGGYGYNQVTGEFDPATPGVQQDLATPGQPSTVFGYLAEALDRRRKTGTPPFSVLSCDNVQGNGELARKVFTSFARLRDERLADWMERNVAFPNCMVDRITPQTTDEDRAMVESTFGIRDNWPVMTEPFMQWIVEDTFCNGRPPLEEVGVQFVADVHPYEAMKLRLLNADHQALAYLGYLCGYRLVHEVMADPLFPLYLARMMDEEVTPLLAPVPGVDLTAYKATLIERFANPKIRDQVLRLCYDASNRMPKFLLPSIHEALASGRPYRLLTLAVAGWFCFLTGTDEQGAPIPLDDALAGTLQPLALQGRDDPRPLLGLHQLFGDLNQHPAFVAELGTALRMLYAEGAHETLAHYLLHDPASNPVPE